ncbi:MAG: restriction endonuclease subunit S [bacterium]
MTWHDYRLGDVLTLKRGHDLPDSQRQDGDVPVISSSGITGRHSEHKAKAPGVVTGRYGTLGEVFYIEEDYWPLNTALYVTDFKGNHPRFVAYFLQSVLRNYQSDKAAVPGVNRNVLHELKVRCPDTESQQRIVDILSAYDDLIENNRRRMALLEEAARHLYREWFVRLRFPGHEHTPITNGVPEGWERIYLGDAVDTQYGFTETATEEPVGPKFLRGTDINKTPFIDWSTVPYCPIDEILQRKYQLRVGDIVIIRMADPGKVAIVERDIDAVFASYLIRLLPTDPRLTPYYLYYCLSDDEYQGFISGVSTGSTRKTASAPLLADFHMILPPETLLRTFEGSVRPLRQQITTLLIQNEKLRAARDLLLPRLMSGQLIV